MRKNKWSMNFFALVLALSMIVCSGCAGEVKKTASETKGVEKEFVFTVVDAEGKETIHEIVTTKDTVGEALLEEGLIEGDEGPYGIYVKTVDGKTLDYDKDGKYWAFYVNDEYAVSGVDKTEIIEGATYAFKAEK